MPLKMINNNEFESIQADVVGASGTISGNGGVTKESVISFDSASSPIRNPAGFSKKFSRKLPPAKTMHMQEGTLLTSLSNTGCINNKSMFSSCWTNSRPVTVPIRQIQQERERVEMSGSDQSDSLMNLLTMDSEGSVDSSLQIRTRVMGEVQEVERTIRNLSSHGPTKPIGM